MLFSSGYINYGYILDDTIIKNGTVSCTDNLHFTYSNGVFTQFSGVYQAGVDYYKLSTDIDDCYFTIPSAPKTTAPNPIAGSVSPRSN